MLVNKSVEGTRRLICCQLYAKLSKSKLNKKLTAFLKGIPPPPSPVTLLVSLANAVEHPMV